MSNKEIRAKDILLKMGVREKQISLGRGVISLTKRNAREESRLLDYKVIDTTPILESLRLNLPGKILDRIDSSKKSGVLAFGDFFKKSCVKYINPNIAYKIVPMKLANITWHAISGYLSGDIVTKFENKGKEGEKGLTSAWFFENCPANESEYDWTKVIGSANLGSSWTHKLKDDNTGALLGNIMDNADAKIGSSSSASAKWRSGDLWDLILQIFKIILTGGIVTNNGFDLTYSWEFNGIHAKTQHIDTRVWIPISGDLTWLWN